MICPNCGQEFEGNFCGNCGTMKSIEIPPLSKPFYVEVGGILFDINLIIRVYGLGVRKIGVYTYISTKSGLSQSIVKSQIDYILDYHLNTSDKTSFGDGLKAQAELSAWEKAHKDSFNSIISSEQKLKEKTYTDGKNFNQSAEQIIQEPVEQKEHLHKMTKKELKLQAHNNGQACCPKCSSVSLSANKKGFGIGKAVAGAFVAGPIGLVAGNMNAKKVWVTCLNCGHRWKM